MPDRVLQGTNSQHQECVTLSRIKKTARSLRDYIVLFGYAIVCNSLF